MPFRDAPRHLRDIYESIEHIELFTQELDFPSYSKDLLVRSAVERQLQIITEAAYRLDDEAEILCPGPDWKGLRGMGNILRHAYHRVNDQVVWDTVQLELPPLKIAVKAALNSK